MSEIQAIGKINKASNNGINANLVFTHSSNSLYYLYLTMFSKSEIICKMVKGGYLFKIADFIGLLSLK